MGQGGAETSTADDDDAGNVDPKQQKHHASHRSVNGAVVDQLWDNVHEERLPDLQEHRDGQSREPDLGEFRFVARRQHEEDAEGVEKNERATHVATEIHHR